jgi:hypothetical protein
MKTHYILSVTLLFISIATFAQSTLKSEVMVVNGNCSMCKKHIETAAKTAGASYAVWNKDTKELAVKYNAKNTSINKIETAIAAVGYDTRNVQSSDAAYSKLDDCCQYDRTTLTSKSKSNNMSCCKDNSCKKDCCNKTDMSCCIGSNTTHDCCKSGNDCCDKSK